MSLIGRAQDEDRNLRRQQAKAHFYAVANWWHFSGSALAIALALVSPVVLLQRPSEGPLLGAVAGVWVFVSRLLFEPVKQRYQLKGAAAQELFDCDVLAFPWNATLVREPADEEIRKASGSFPQADDLERHRSWYPTKVDLAWPESVLTCQRSNAVWARRQHHAYGIFLLVVSGMWGVAGIVLAIVHNTSLAEYLTTVALPSLPAVLDATELAKKHFLASGRRQHLEDETDRLLDNVGGVSTDDLREIQDEIFELRRDAPPVAGWFYRILAKSYEQDMTYAAEQRAGRVSQ